MPKTIAEALWEEGLRIGERRGRQQILLRQLRLRFGRVPRWVERVIRATEDIGRLDAWLKAFARAETLADVGIAAEQDQRDGLVCREATMTGRGQCGSLPHSPGG